MAYFRVTDRTAKYETGIVAAQFAGVKSRGTHLKAFHNRVFESIDGLEHHLEVSLRELEQDTERVRSIVAWPWIIKALMN